MVAPPGRSDGEVLELILAVARADPRVRAVVLSGSRADPAAPADGWRDFDVVYVVRDVAPFRADAAWIDVFGERTILQRPDAMLGAPPRDDGGEAYLMLFADGHRIDLTLLPVAAMADFRHDGPADVLLDLDGVVPAPPAPGAPHHVPEPPTEAAFAGVCNEFWWVAPYVAKGLARGQLTYARHHLDTVLRAQLLTMLGWEVAAASGFRRGPGKAGRDLQRLLPPETWARLEATYADADPAHGWAALEAMAGLFRTVARGVAARFALTYPEGDDERVTEHLARMRAASVVGRAAELDAWEAAIAEFFEGHPDARALFERVRLAVAAVGSATLRVSRSQVAFRRRRSFAFAWRPGRYLSGSVAPLVLSVALPERDPSPRWKEVVEPTPGTHLHHLELRRVDDVDDEVGAWLLRAWLAAGRPPRGAADRSTLP